MTRMPAELSRQITCTLVGLSLQIEQTLEFVVWLNPYKFEGHPKILSNTLVRCSLPYDIQKKHMKKTEPVQTIRKSYHVVKQRN